MKNKKLFALLTGAVLIFSIFATGCSSDKGESMKSFTAATLDGGRFSDEDIRDKDLTVINFWGTFCVPCIAEMPDLAEFSKALPDNVRLITVCVDAYGNEEAAKTILQQSGYEGITLVGGDGDFASLLYTIQLIPTTIFVDSDGNLVGEAIEGGQQNLSDVYLAAVNSALTAGGKDEISLEK